MQKNTLTQYILGYTFSLTLTFFSLLCVHIHKASNHEMFTHGWLAWLIVGFMLMQLFVQAKYFLHMNVGDGSRLNTATLAITISIILIIVIGSLWIMTNLQHNMSHLDISDALENEAIPHR